MKALISKFSFLFLFVIATQILAQDDTEKLKALIQDGNNKYAKAMIEGTYDTMLSGYADDAVVMPSYSPMQKGIDAIKAGMDMDAKSGNKFTEFNLTATDVFENGNWVYEIGKYTMTMEIKGMDKPYKDEGKFLTLFEKQSDGTLKIKADIWNSDLNPWTMMGNKEEESQVE